MPATFQNPVIVVPGITATTMHDDYPLNTRDLWTMVLKHDYRRLSLHPDNGRYETKEPARVYAGRLFSIYNDLIEALRHDLTRKADQRTPVFAFPYDWRRGVEETAGELAEFVEEVLARTKLLRHYDGFERINKVDLVGHSMGGLVICEYLHQLGSAGRVGKVATLGTPFLGSLEAVVKLTTGMGSLAGERPSEREREAARTMRAVYQLLPSFAGAATWEQGGKVNLFDPANWQRSVLDSITEHVRLHSVKDHSPVAKRKAKGRTILKGHLDSAKRHRGRVKALSPSAAGLEPDAWLAVVGLGENTRIAVTVKKPANPRFVISEDQFVDEWKDNPESRRTGDGTVPLAGALPPFLPEEKLVCVCDQDFGFFELRDKALAGVAGLHGLLPAMNLVQRLVLRHFRPDFGGDVWGRRLPGVDARDWVPPIKKLQDET